MNLLIFRKNKQTLQKCCPHNQASHVKQCLCSALLCGAGPRSSRRAQAFLPVSLRLSPVLWLPWPPGQPPACPGSEKGWLLTRKRGGRAHPLTHRLSFDPRFRGRKGRRNCPKKCSPHFQPEASWGLVITSRDPLGALKSLRSRGAWKASGPGTEARHPEGGAPEKNEPRLGSPCSSCRGTKSGADPGRLPRVVRACLCPQVLRHVHAVPREASSWL